MKNTYFLLFILIAAVSVHAQNFQLGAGPAFSMKGSVSYPTTPEGRQNGFALAKLPAFGISSYIPVSTKNKLGIVAGINYETYSYMINEFEGDDFQNNHTYLTINPNFCFNWFLFGFNFGIPLSADYEGNEIKTGKMNTSIELIAGGHFNIYDDETGRFVFFFELGYMLNGIYDDYPKNDPLAGVAQVTEMTEDKHNPRTGSVTLGFSYLFNLTEK